MSCLLWIHSSPGTQIVLGFQLLLGLRRMEESDWTFIFHNQTIISCQKPSSSYFYLIFSSHCHLPAKTKEILVLGDKSARCTEEGSLKLDLVFSAPLSTYQQRAHFYPAYCIPSSPPLTCLVSAFQEILVHSLLFQDRLCSSFSLCLLPLPPSYLSTFLPFISMSKVARNVSSQLQSICFNKPPWVRKSNFWKF